MDCSICFEPITQRTGKCELACGHLFHISCHIQWAQSHETCPMCRARLSQTERVSNTSPLDFSELFHGAVPPKSILRFTKMMTDFTGFIMVYKSSSSENHYDTTSDTDNVGFHDFSEFTQGILCIHTKDTEIYTRVTNVFMNAFPRATITIKKDGTEFKL